MRGLQHCPCAINLGIQMLAVLDGGGMTLCPVNSKAATMSLSISS
jgi:hypothetical protein